ncbi:demethoxyubiquinone hydroxylase family protein [Skermanella sp. TT6]|uniref:3-demethoxyubiquinol 3-hydroxylase n=1 Tax=Skermanella cutis TaxID=2775420 RepID=A0ABX7BCV8_9PROT|nr:demethoxyubiquinone hydroxylase family protein [Skermanella sp. TT6]
MTLTNERPQPTGRDEIPLIEASPGRVDEAGPPKPSRPRYLPGDPEIREQLARMIRVNHAGEYGAKRIYEGQLAVLRNSPAAKTIRHMQEQEQEHLDTFSRLIVERRVRPTALHPLWHVAGFALGAATALMGQRAAMACTVAVEEVIDEHYAQQAEQLGDTEPELKGYIEKFRAEELEHRDIGLAHEAEQAPAYQVLTGLIKAGSRAAIWAAQRF